MNLSEELVEPGRLASRLGHERMRVLDVTVQITPALDQPGDQPLSPVRP